MSINENNIKDIDDSTILENTPMVVIEQGGQTIAIPLMGGGGVDQVQADWSQTDDTAVDFIKNKPEIVTPQRVVYIDNSQFVDLNVEANTRYVLNGSSVSRLTIESAENSTLESEIQFRSNDNITVIFPNDVHIVRGAVFDTLSNYIISIKNSIAVVAEYE